ncbi:glucosyltransferase domain-containing protein [Citrobacter freundii]|uniref:glucosyltransferase domain-containing protein n=1 Tax=Citrobacter portucalensis TaxID=1639133 RepID=UPI0015E932BC|nr:glucosyltransferase domain-containing protein [Citrobacter freundii]
MKNNNIIICFILCLLYIFPSVTGGVYYNDDMFRSIYAYYGWVDDGRPVAEYIYRSLTMNNLNVIDSFPLLLIIAIGIYCYVCIRVVNNITDKKGIAVSLASCSLIFSPFFASNLWFRYDSFFMVLSVTSALYPYSINGSKYKILLIGVISLVLCSTLYQPALSIFICMASVEIMCLTIRRDANLKSLLSLLVMRISSISIAVIVYLKIVIPITTAGYYFSNYNKVIDFSYNGIATLYNNYISAYSIFYLMLQSPFVVVFLIIAILAALSAIYCIRESKCWYKTLLSIIICFATIFAFIPGLGVFSSNMPVFPRTFISLGMILYAPMLLIALSNINIRIKYSCLAVVYFYCFLFFYSSSNAVREEYNNKTMLSSRIIATLDRLGLSSHESFLVDGTASESPLFNVTAKLYPFLNNMKPNTFWGGYDGGRFMLMRSGMKDIRYPDMDTSSKISRKLTDATPLFSSKQFSVFEIDNIVVIKM